MVSLLPFVGKKKGAGAKGGGNGGGGGGGIQARLASLGGGGGPSKGGLVPGRAIPNTILPTVQVILASVSCQEGWWLTHVVLSYSLGDNLVQAVLRFSYQRRA
jgi:hypothetical protein